MERVTFDNDKIIKSFTQEEKEELFDTLMAMYFHKNFGSLSKTDLETYLFSFYLEHLLNNQFNYDDYTVGKDLGLTLSRVRGLKGMIGEILFFNMRMMRDTMKIIIL